MKSDNIVSYTSETMPKDTQTDWARLEAMTEEEIEFNALSDPDAPPLTEDELASAVAIRPGD